MALTKVTHLCKDLWQKISGSSSDGTSVTPTSDVCHSTILLLLLVGN